MAVVNLLGDSIIDNKIYVGPHELSVTAVSYTHLTLPTILRV